VGRKASRHVVSARTQRDREPWKARSGESARLGSAVGAMNLERAVEHRNEAGGRTDRMAARPEGTRGGPSWQVRGCLDQTLERGESLRKGTLKM
jgi:hypothetical protein